MNYIKKYFNTNLWALPLSAWMLFSLFYWYSAYIKPFTPNGFMSWVYVSKCSYLDLLTLRDSGIGHPPLFHFLQKLVQDFLPGYHFLHVRLLNYFLGSVFIVLLAQYLLKFKKNLFFILSISISAAILNAFVYARMWGGMALLSLVMIILGESYLNSKNKKYKLFIIIVLMVGLFYDYNFVLMMPYAFFVFIDQSKYKKKFLIFSFSSFIFIWVIAFGITIYKIGWSMSIYTNLTNIYKMGFNLFNLLFYSWYMEIVGLVMFFLVGILFLQYRKKGYSEFHAFLGILLFLGFIFLFINLGSLRIRYAFFLLPLPVIFYFVIKENLIYDSFNRRFLLSIIFGTVIILSISPLFWRDLVINRFIIIFLPIIIMLFYKNFSDRALTILSIFLIISGITFASSSYLNDYFLPRSLKNSNNLIFESSGFYATQYLKNEIETDEVPKFLSLSNFESGCRICTMGTDEIDYSKLDSIYFVSYAQLPIKLLLNGYKINKSKVFGLTELDKIQLKYLTPLHSNYSLLYEMVKDNAKK